VAAALIVLAAAGATGAVILMQQSPEPSLTKMSNAGTPTKLNLGRGTHMGGPALTGDAFLIAQRENRRFYRLPRADGTTCWASGRLRKGEWRVGSMTCMDTPQFPSRKYPLQDFSPVEMSLGRPHPHYLWLLGLAADGVKRIAVIDADNRVVPAAEVVDNVYFTDELPKGDFFGLAALDGDGDIIWRSSPVE
jgi:hypothetical protein